MSQGATSSEGRNRSLVPATNCLPIEDLREVLESVSGRRSLEATPLHRLVEELTGTTAAGAGHEVSLLASTGENDEILHGLNVAILSVALARSLGLSEGDIKEVCRAALLHDVGKFLVPSGILRKPQRLTDEEFEVVRRHPSDGARLLLQTPGAPELAVIVAFEHHLANDGRGYPEVPHGWKINLASAITSIADCFDGLRTRSSGGEGRTAGQVAAILSVESGTRFDAGLLETFIGRVVPRVTLRSLSSA